MEKHVAVALSGGLDSAVAAALLKKGNHQVIALHFRTGYESPPGGTDSSDQLSPLDSRAERVAEQIGIPLEVIDCSEAFENEVVRYFVDAYRSGQTPNPCVVCNQRIKFGFILEEAKARGASVLATGHYARIRREENGRFYLIKGVDREKDQSYFLARLAQEQLGQAVFPLGTYTKKQVREMAGSFGLTSFREEESQELCFVGEPNYKEFLSKYAGLPNKPGVIVNRTGDTLGRHNGLHAYTIGQRKGINIPGPAPYYVLRLDQEENQLVIGSKSELAATECLVTQINWIGAKPPDKPILVKTRIRYRHQEVDSTLTPLDGDSATVHFSEPQYAITPGQAAVFYEGERVLGGGWIE
ncbi:MAG: tRNA 2-thiouridine(34) synthase MnmA [Deltaproteobacteria bacterium]|nr:tRNA 2-thiouridine(34) synthase MnmA [Deltaproteobacteria bacterium]MBW2171939.1 tRNA 2-thiouridine(34) synthase MnmA [Deltaproteobacteria bacterium]